MGTKTTNGTTVVPATQARYSFYRPHARVVYDGTSIDEKTGEYVTLPSMTKQAHVAECDINNILKTYKRTGMLTHVNARAAQGVFRDLPDQTDYQESLNIVMRGEAAFDALPSKLRERFHNDPEEFLLFMADPANQDEAIALGIATDTRPPPEPPTPSAQEAQEPPQAPK